MVEKGGHLIYPGLEGDFLSRPLSSVVSEYYSKIIRGEQDIKIVKKQGRDYALKDFEMDYILNKICKLKQLNHFCVQKIKFYDSSVKILSDILTKNYISDFKILELRAVELTEESIQGIANALEENKTLTKLNLAENFNVGKVINKISEALEKNKTLLSLNLDHTNLSKETQSLRILFDLKNEKRNKTITEIFIDGNKIINSYKKLIESGVSKNNGSCV